ncbi:MAG: NAD(P)/FAD-dependent oxidoreductase [Neisseriaceae bacterium]|nr:NAD(P)/FAD-dependent oxidoreductase [Neisseriaceae bacterium]
MSDTIGLTALEQRIQQDLAYLNLPIAPWALSPQDDHHLDVAIIGAGMAGVTAAFALKLKGITAQVFDQNPDGHEGPWRKPALMETLRSPKHVVGPALASPSLTFQAWFKAQFGDEAWDQLDKIPRLQWAEYLQWFKKMTAPSLHHRHTLTHVDVAATGVWLTFDTPNGTQRHHAQHVILALGMEAFSEPNIPDFIRHVPTQYWAHSYDGSDYRRFKGLDVGVVGYSAGAMDSSATALEHGAKSVELLCRCHDFPRVNRGKIAGGPGFESAYAHFSDAQKWHYAHYVAQAKTPAPHGSTLRVSRHPNAYFNFDSPVEQVVLKDHKLHVRTPKQTLILDFLILATGYRINWHKPGPLAHLSAHIKTWQDVYAPPAAEQDAALAQHPYLSDAFELQAKTPGGLPGVDRLYCLNLTASLSLGPVVGLIPGTNTGARRLADKIAAKLYMAHHEQHLALVKNSTDCELVGDEWTRAAPYDTRQPTQQDNPVPATP